MDDLGDLRARLDGVDRRLVEALRERLETVRRTFPAINHRSLTCKV